MPDSSLTRPYRGIAAGDRISSRREALIDATLEVFAAEGWAAVSARRVCERAGLTRRYFYESFDDVDALLGAVFDRIAGEVREALRAVAADRAGSLSDLVTRAVSAGLDVLASPPAKGRFLAASLTAGSSIAAHRARSIDDLAAIVEAVLLSRRDRPPLASREARITAITAVGAVLSIINSWLTQETDLTKEEVASWSATAAIGIIDAVAARTQ